ncbi:MAG: hypothetical protein U0V02_12205 [Anaerolineales bacterium]
MIDSLKVFLYQVIDYAGLYPPANLPLEAAFSNFLEYQQVDDAWMLSRFIIPARRLSELPRFYGDLSFSILGRGGKDTNEFLENLKLDIEDIRTFREMYGTNMLADMFEVALPASSLDDNISVRDVVNSAADMLNMNGLTVFFEVPFGDEWQTRAEKLVRVLRKFKDRHIGFKLRTGGVTADAFPSTEQVAWAIASARDAGVPMKCTAGLHHPVRHFNEGVQTKMHGFLNVFGAGVLAVANNLSVEQIETILEDEDPASFVFDEAGFVWRDLRVGTSKIKLARQQVVSFGSCSFDEPREDLRSIGLLK